MEFREMKYLLEISRTGNIAQAAENLYITQPALRKTINKIESVYNAPLFYKEGRKLIPTEIGQEIIEFADSMLASEAILEAKIFDIQHLNTGVVSIGFPSYVANRFLTYKLFNFQKKHPNITLNTYEGGGSELTRMVLSGELDMAFVMRPVLSDEVNEINVIRDAVVCCVNKTNPLAEKGFVTLEDLKDSSIVTFNSNFNVPNILQRKFSEAGLSFEPKFVGEDPLFLFKYAMLAEYILILPYPMIHDFIDRDKHTLLPFSPAFPWEISIISRKSSYTSYAVQTLLSNLIYAFHSQDEP